MQTVQISNLEVNELQELIENSVKKVLEQNASKKETDLKFMTREEVADMLQISLVMLNEWISLLAKQEVKKGLQAEI
jgi:hypothetical protein